jgi:hypothetical protein
MLLFIAGCGNKALKENYDNMEIGKDNINGYKLDLRIYGKNGNNTVNEIIRVTDYNDKEYEITKVSTSIKDIESGNNEETIYIKDGKTYVEDKNGKYIEGKNDTYNNPSLYLEGLKNIKSREEPIKKKIGENSYTKYNVVFKNSIVKEIVEDTVLKGMNIKEDVNGEVYIDKEGYVYRIIYKLDGVTINANYYGMNTVRPINIPSNIKIQ